MKHFRLLLTLFALTLGWTNVCAQTWTGSEVGEGKALLYNVGTGMYLTRGNGWDTQASIGSERAAMTVLLENFDGKYKIRTNINGDGKGFEHLSGGTVYSDQSANKNSTWTFTNVGTQDDPVYNIISADNHGGGADFYLTAEGGESTIVGPGSDGTADNAKWKVYLIEDQQAKVLAVMPNATTENPVDATVLIGNPDFSTAIAPTGQPWTMNASNQNLSGGATLTNPVAESWQSAFTLSQTITVPNGYYRVQAQAFIREYNETGANYPVVYINDATKPFIKMVTETASLAVVSNYFAGGDNGENYSTGWTDAVTVTNKTITVGTRGTRTDTWCAFDNFQLQYLGPIDLTEYANQLAAAVEAAEAVEGTIPAAIYEQIAAVISENNKTYDNEEDYIAAINAVNNAVSTYATADIVADYSRYKIVKAAALQAAPNTVVSDADALVEAATTTNAIDEAIATLRQALITELPNVVIAEGNYLDLTNALIDNPTVSENVDYWNVENVGRPYDWSTGPTTNYGETEFYQSTFDFNQTLTLAKGTYEFGVTGFHRAGNHATYFYAGEDKVLIPGVESSVVNSMAEAKTYFDNGNGKVALKFALDNESNTLKIGIVNNDTETDRWTIFRNFTLKYFGSQIDLSSYEELLAAAVAAAEAVEGTVPSTVYQTLATVVSDNNQTYTTKDAYLTAIAAIEEATATAKAMQDPYNRYQFVKAAVVAISETISTSEADTQADAATTTEAIDGAITTLRSNLLVYLPTAEVAEGEYIDLTNAMVDNPTVRQNTNYWTIEGTPNGTYSWGKVANEECEFYQQNFNFYQTLTLSKGTYEFGVTGFHRAGNHATYFYAGEDKILIPGVANDVVNTMAAAKEYFDAGNGKVALKFALENESNTLKIGIVNNDTETDKWTIFRDFTLKYYGSQVDLSSYEEAWNEAVAAAEAAIAANPNVTGEELTAVNTAKADVPEQTKESYMTKTEALANATAALVAAAPSYNLYSEKKAFVDNFEALPYADPAKKPTTEGTEAPANAQEAVTKANALTSALRLYVESNALAEGVEGAVDMTSKILNNNNPENTNNWTADVNLGENVASFVVNSGQPYTAGDGTTGGKYFDGGAASWGNGNWEAKISQDIMLAPGTYVLSVTSRAQANVNKYNLFAGENKVEMGHIGSAADAGLFGNGFNDYYITFEVTAENPTVTIGIEVGAEEAYTWYSFSRFRLTQIENKAVFATDEELIALTESLQPTAKLGFDEGDYAPYNNVENLTTAEAEIAKVYAEMESFEGKALQSTVLAATEAIQALTWTANTEEVNAVYDGTFASAENNGAPSGWTMSNNTLGGDYHSRAFVGDDRLAEFNETNSGFFLRFDGTNSNRGSMYYYGNTTGYTMPLKANTNYYVKVDFAGWGSTGKPLRINITGPEGFTAVSMTENTSVRADNANETPQQFLISFTTAEAGNYVINFQTPGSDDNKHNVVVSNFELFKEKALKGDVNGDQKVNIADVTALVNAIAEGEQPAAGDLDGVEGVTADDVKALVDLILHNE